MSCDKQYQNCQITGSVFQKYRANTVRKAINKRSWRENKDQMTKSSMNEKEPKKLVLKCAGFREHE